MKKKKNNSFDRQLEKNSSMVIIIAGFLGVVSLCFTAFCMYKIYESAYTTCLNCSASNFMCTITNKNIIGQETVVYEFKATELMKLKVARQKNILQEEVYYLTLDRKLKGGKKETYLLTTETPTKEEQEQYMDQMDAYLNYETNELNLENPRYKLKFIGLCAALASGLVALFMFFDCIKGMMKVKKKSGSKDDYRSILDV